MEVLTGYSCPNRPSETQLNSCFLMSAAYWAAATVEGKVFNLNEELKGKE